MSSFWPEGLSLKDTQSPYEVLKKAQEEWETASNGELTLVLQETMPEDGNTVLIVHAKHISSNRTITLFSVIHRLDALYPITIQVQDDNLPKVLKKSYYQPGVSDLVGGVGGMVQQAAQGKNVKNKWVSDTPSEFRNKLGEAFNLSLVKAAVFNLVSGGQTMHKGDVASRK